MNTLRRLRAVKVRDCLVLISAAQWMRQYRRLLNQWLGD